MANSDDVKQAAIDIAKTGIVSKTIGDRSFQYAKPTDILEFSKQLATTETPAKAFFKVGFRSGRRE